MQDPRNLNLSFDGKTLDYIVNVLAQRPYAECAPVLADIQQQVRLQQLPAAAALTNGHAPADVAAGGTD